MAAAERSPYHAVSRDDLILRDRLAVDRTILANERTFLAYLRTALTLFIGGVSLVQFFETPWVQVAGWTMIPGGPVFVVWGIGRYVKMRRRLNPIR